LFGVLVFSLKIRNNVRIGAIAQPEIIVAAPVAKARNFQW
jgi:hypothetical protein